MDGSAATPQLIYRNLVIERAAADKQSRTIRASLSSELPYERFGETEILSHAPDAIDLTRAKDGLPLLFAHDHTQPIGLVEDVKIEARTLRGTLRFSRSARAEEIFQDVLDGTLRNLSIGYIVQEREPLKRGYLVKRFTVYEASIVAIPADHTVGINRSANTQEHGMEGTTTQDNVITAPMQTREIQVRDIVKAARLDASFADQIIASGVTIDKAREIVINRLADNDMKFPTRSANYTANPPQQDGVEIKVKLFAEALAQRAGVPASEAAREYSGFRVTDMARQLLELRGIRTTAMNPTQLIERAGAMHTTSDFSQLLLGTGDRILRQAYASYAGGIKRIAGQSTARDFRNKTRVQLGEFPELLPVNEHGEIKYGSTAEASESYKLRTYARIFAITRQALVNDDLGAFATMTAQFGRSAAELEAKILVDLLTSNPVMADGLAVFHATHGNLAASGSAISIASLGAARQAMRLQKGLDATTPIDVTPRFLVVPAALETLAEQFIATITPNQSSQANPFAGQLELVVDPRLDANSATAWYLAADPNSTESIEYSFLEGAQGPQTAIREGWTVLGSEIRCVLDFGAAVLDFRGLYRNPGI